MSVVNSIITVVIINYIYFAFSSTIYDIKTNYTNKGTIKSVRYFVLITLIIIIINLLEFPLLNLAINFIAINFISFKFHKVPSIKYMVIMNTIFLVFIVFIDMIVHPLLNVVLLLLNINDINIYLYSFLTATLFSIIVLFTSRIFKLYLLSNKNYIDVKKNLLLSILLPAYSVLIIYTLMVNSDFKNMLYVILSIIICIGLIILNIFLLKIFEVFYKNAEFKSYINASEHFSKVQLSYYKDLSRKNDELTHHIHDTKRHIQMIKSLYESNKYNIANKYIDIVNNSYDKYTKIFSSTNIVLDILINDKINKAKSLNIDLIANDTSTGLKFINDTDLVLLFSNLIDNAIDATINSIGNKIYIIIDKHNDFTCINIQNYYTEIKENSKGRLLSTKNNHLGYGLDIVNDIIEKYDASISINYDKVFTVIIMFPDT